MSDAEGGEAEASPPEDQPTPLDVLSQWMTATPGPGQTQLPIGVTLQQSQTTTWTGPFPPPEAIERLNQIEPGLGTRLVREFTNETEHRRQLEREGLRVSAAATSRGQWFAFIVLLVVALGAILLGMYDHTEAAIALAAMDVAIPAAVFVIRGWRGDKASRDDSD